MRIKINGVDLQQGDRVTIETSDIPDSVGWLVAAVGLLLLGELSLTCNKPII